MNQNKTIDVEFAFDIETIPDMDKINKLPDSSIKIGAMKDPEKIRKKRKDPKERIKIMQLDPFYGRICSYAMHGNNGINHYYVLPYINDRCEKELINSIFNYMKRTKTTTPRIITYNGSKFDMRFLYTRVALLDIQLPSGIDPYPEMCKRYENHRHLDLLEALHGFNISKSLEHTAMGSIGRGKDDCDFSKFIEWIENKQGEKIGLYNLTDAKVTYEVYKKFKSSMYS